ncbi:AraC-like DNA-binding protein [Chitinophaga sp. W3I9]|uniref:AraC family transcriptional regulator n=1 Tax=Chitinophaga sp. W3I9 TaxID=3373924 RepID=UPI003D1F1ED7
MKNKRNQNVNYLTVNETDELWGLYTTTIGFQVISPNSDYPPKSHPSAYWFSPNTGRVLQEYILLYITEGEGSFESASCKLTKVVAGTILLLFPGEWHTYRPLKGKGWNEYWVGFNGSYMKQLTGNLFFCRKSPVYNVGFNEQIVALFNQGIETANYQKMAYQQVLSGITSLLLGFIFYAEKNNSFRDKAIIAQIDKARMMMREKTGDNVTPESIAKTLNIGYSWFRRVFKQYTGFSPAQYQLEIKLQKSKELLASTILPVKEIAFHLNFESASYFVTFFKSKTGLSPGEYRDKIKGK